MLKQLPRRHRYSQADPRLQDQYMKRRQGTVHMKGKTPTVMSSRLYSFPVLVCVPHKVGVSSRPSLHAAGIEARRRLLIKVFKVLSVQRMLHSWLMRCLRAVQVVPVHTPEEGVALQHSANSQLAALLLLHDHERFREVTGRGCMHHHRQLITFNMCRQSHTGYVS